MAKIIELFSDQEFADRSLEILDKYDPGSVYLLKIETNEGYNVALCDEPFTKEEVEEQHPEGDTLSEEDMLEEIGEQEEEEFAEAGDVVPELEEME